MSLTGSHVRAALAAVGAVGKQIRSWDELAEGANDALSRAPQGLTKEGAAAFLATMAQESAYFRTTTEYGSGQRYAPYIGRTFEQVTWESNYAKFGAWCKGRGYIDDADYFVRSPARLSDYKWAWLGGVWYFEHTGLWAYANAGDFKAVSQGVNGGMGRVGTSFTPNGWSHRLAMYNAFLKVGARVLPEGGTDGPPAQSRTVLRYGDTGPDVKALQKKLGIAADGSFGPSMRAAVEAFQRVSGLEVDGIAGPNTQAAIRKAGEAADELVDEGQQLTKSIAEAVAWAKVARRGYGGMCLKHARMAYGVPAKHASAIKAWNAIPNSKKVVGTHRNAPLGSFLYWHPKGSPYGHVAVVIQSGADPLVATTDSQQPTTKVYRASVFNRVGYKTAGWSWVVNDVDVRAGQPGKAASKPKPKKPGKKGKKIAVDGYVGVGTTKALQRLAGIKRDGKISGQPKTIRVNGTVARTLDEHWPTIEYGRGGSQLIAWLQGQSGVKTDGYAGPKTWRAIQRMVRVKADGIPGPNTVKALQRWTNKKNGH